MRIYTISGLGADRRVFRHLKLDAELVPLEWIPHHNGESLANYAVRLAQGIDGGTPFGLLGVSFGGAVAVEVSRVCPPSFLILVSSVANRKQLPWYARALGKTGLLRLSPKHLFDPPRPLAYWLFGTRHHTLLSDILDQTDLAFAKWAVQALLTWPAPPPPPTVPLLRLHGALDRLLPPSGLSQEVIVPHGHHLMVVDRAAEVSVVINKWLR